VKSLRSVFSYLLLILGVGFAGACQDTSVPERPNILWLSIEDASPHLGCYGDPYATTPHVDRLAEEGVLYQNAFTTAGVCAPSRSAIITGMYQTSLGTHHMRCRAELPEPVRPFPIYLREAGYYCTNNSKEDYQFVTPANTWDESSSEAHWKNRPDNGQPFFAVFNFNGCHESGIANDAKYERVTEGIERHDRDLVSGSLPPYYPDSPVTREDWGRYYDVMTAMDRWVGEHLAALEEAGLADNTIVIFWSDHGVGLPRAKRWLYDSGIRVPLIVRMPQRFRVDTQGQPGTLTDELVSLMDLGPTALNLAGAGVPDHMKGRPFLGVNLPEPRRYIFGARDRMDERYDIIRAVRDERFKYIRNYEPFKTYYQYMNTPEKGRTMQEIRRVEADGSASEGVAAFLVQNKPPEELYDTANDPHEMNNLVSDPEFSEVLERMRQAHDRWVVETGDLGLIPEAEINARQETAGSAWGILQTEGSAELMGQIRDTASLSLQGSEMLLQLKDAVSHEDSAVRYWAAIGVGNLGEEGESAASLMEGLLTDQAENVRIAAARALCRMGKPGKALPVLVAILDEGSQWARVQASNVLDEMDDQALPVLDDMKRNLEPREDLVQRGKYTVRALNQAVNQLQGTANQVP